MPDQAATPTQPTRTPFRTFTNTRGRTFAVRVVPHGARYGRVNCLLNEDATLVEFYDTTYADDGHGDYVVGTGFGALGQFTGGRYFLSTLLGTDGTAGGGTGGLCIDGGVPEWDVDAATMSEVRAWLAGHVTDLDRERDAKRAANRATLHGQLVARRSPRHPRA